MALGGVATGNIKAREQAIAAPMEKKKGEIFRLTASEIIMGIIIFAVAVFEVSSVEKMTKPKIIIKIAKRGRPAIK